MRFFPKTCLFLLGVNLCFAAQLNGLAIDFDVKKANQQFDRINLQLSVQNLNLSNLVTAVNTIEGQIALADACVEDAQKKLNNISLLIKQGNSAMDRPKEGVDLIYLSSQQKDLADEQAQCRLFSIRAKEAIEAYKTAVAQLKQEQALARGVPLWNLLKQLVNSPPNLNPIDKITTLFAAGWLSILSWLFFLGMALIAASMTLHHIQKKRFTHHFLRFRKVKIKYVFLLALFFLAGGTLFYRLACLQDINTSDPTLELTGIVFSYLLAFMVILLLFKLKKTRAFFYWSALEVTFFQSFCVTLLSFYTLVWIGRLYSHSFNTHIPEWYLCQSLLLLAILVTGAYFIHHFCRTHRQLLFIKHHYHFIQRFSMLLLATCAMIDIFGYHTLARYLIISGFTTCAIIIITLLLTQGVKKLYLALNQQPVIKSKIIHYFGYRTDQPFTEFLILKSTIQLIIIAISIYIIGQSWGFATDYIESIYDQFLYGVHLVNVIIYPTRIISGVIVFCVLYLIFRAISTALTRQQQFENEEETQVAIASILTYVGFGLALISGLLVAGFNFTGLTIIAGALSVGIGLGLQSIVNNFVSGIILLIEKPIRPGDRISVDGVEGFVKKIRVRSTQIITPNREDIIVPNADLISRRVTNFMFSDKYCRINCEVNIPYGSDTYLVREVLLNIANNHEEIIKGGRHKPTVLFRSFAEKTLVFQLSCLIKDVNKKSIVQSELNFSIDQAFREHGIWKYS